MRRIFAQASHVTGSVARDKEIFVVYQDSNCEAGNYQAYMTVPSNWNNLRIKSLYAIHTGSVGAGGTHTRIQISIERQSNRGTYVDLLTTPLQIDSGERDSSTAATEYVINSTHNTLYTGDLLWISITQCDTTTPPKGLSVVITVE